MPASKAMLNAHVEFELKHWSGSEIDQSLAEETSAAYNWLGSVTVSQLVSDTGIGQTLTDVICDAPLGENVASLVGAAVRAAHAAGVNVETTLEEVVAREHYDDLAQTIIAMEEVRGEVLAQVTTSEVYSQLMAHVVYLGIKNYMQNENVIAKKVPGASALMRLGQNAVNSAAPKLEQSIDRQLTAFVNANIQDTIRDSRRYLEKVLDTEVLTTVADEIWATNAGTTVADGARLVPVESIEALVVTTWDACLVARSTPLFRDAVEAVIADFVDAHADQPITDLLAEAGIDERGINELAKQFVAPVIAKAVDDGFLEDRIRARLEAFYSSYKA